MEKSKFVILALPAKLNQIKN